MPFTTTIIVTPIEETRKCTIWKVVEPLNFHSEKTGKNYVVPAGTITNLRSGVRKNATAAAIVHDHLYHQGEHFKQIEDRREADEIYLEASLACGVAPFQAHLDYAALRMFGRSHYSAEE